MNNQQLRTGATFYTADNRPLMLGEELGRGGEGSVWSVIGDPSSVAKFYHSGLSTERARKIEVMCSLKSNDILRIAAWPLTTLKAFASGSVDGFLMPRVKGHREAHLLYTPKSRKTNFPEAQFPFILHASLNIARAFATVHDIGQVIGDVNHGNLLIGKDATAALIDCDSFQIQAGGAVFPCLVGVSTYTPPELQRTTFQSVRRSAHHDQFGLAVLLFHMLFMGRHPFAGIFRHGNADKTIEDAIREFRFAYLPDNRVTEMEPPPAVPRLSEIPQDVAQLFIRAFSKEGATGQRPSAHEWLRPLESFSRTLRKCSANDAHHYFNAAAACPWCRVENAFGISMFGIRLTIVGGGAFDLTLVWAQIEAVQPDTHAPAAPEPGSFTNQCQLDPDIGEIKNRRRVKRALSIGSIVLAVLLVVRGRIQAFPSICILTLGLFTMTRLWKTGEHYARRITDGYKTALNDYNGAMREWNLIEAVPPAFQETKRRLETERQKLTELPSIQARKMAVLNAARREKQLTRFLERHRIADANIPGIGPGRKSLLACYNVEDASDVIASNLNIKGFGPALRTALLAWRTSIEREFVFNPNEGIDPGDVRNVEIDIATFRAALVKSIGAGPQALRSILSRWQEDRHRLFLELDRRARLLAQGQVNFRALRGF